MSVSAVSERLAPQTGTALSLECGDRLEIVDVEGEQVADVAIFSVGDVRERFSPGRTLDYNETFDLTTGGTLYSNRSNPLMAIETDDVGRHDFLLAPCSARMFEILRNVERHPSCLANLAGALAPYGIAADDIDATFNAFMNVTVSPGGGIAIAPPRSKAGDRVVLRALSAVVVGVTACSSEHTNNGRCKAIAYRVIPAVAEKVTPLHALHIAVKLWLAARPLEAET